MALNGVDEVMAKLDEITEESNDAIRRIFVKTQNRIIEASPVDTGEFRNRWIPIAFGQNIFGKTYELINTAPYANVIEYGGFTQETEVDTPEGKKMVKQETEMTINGFSKQAPQGVVRINLEKAREEIKKI